MQVVYCFYWQGMTATACGYLSSWVKVHFNYLLYVPVLTVYPVIQISFILKLDPSTSKLPILHDPRLKKFQPAKNKYWTILLVHMKDLNSVYWKSPNAVPFSFDSQTILKFY